MGVLDEGLAIYQGLDLEILSKIGTDWDTTYIRLECLFCSILKIKVVLIITRSFFNKLTRNCPHVDYIVNMGKQLVEGGPVSKGVGDSSHLVEASLWLDQTLSLKTRFVNNKFS